MSDAASADAPDIIRYMQAIRHDITYYRQPTRRSCGYTSLAILLSHYGIDMEPLEIQKAIIPDDDENYGSITAEVAAWCQQQGLAVSMYSADFLITDFAWQGYDTDKLLERLQAVRETRNIVSLGAKTESTRYVDAYINLLRCGASLTITPHPTSQQLYDLLQAGPVFANVCPKVLSGRGRSRVTDDLQSVPDDVNGRVGTHSLVIYGNDTEGNFLIADPWDGELVKAAETVVCAIVAAEIECDAQWLVVDRR